MTFSHIVVMLVMYTTVAKGCGAKRGRKSHQKQLNGARKDDSATVINGIDTAPDKLGDLEDASSLP